MEEKMSFLEKPLDFESLEVELYDAIKADTLYQLENDAKLRAIEQRVPTYDQFKDMVNAAHLKPMERSDMRPKLGVQWNSAAASNLYKTQSMHCFPKLPKPISCKSHNDENDVKFGNRSIDEITVPKTTEEFLNSWKKLRSHKEKYDFLSMIKPVTFTEIFRPEIPLGILGEIMDSYLRNLEESMNDVDTIIETLIALSNCNRFQLGINFLTQIEKDICKQFFLRLFSTGKTDEITINTLRKKYQITLD